MGHTRGKHSAGECSGLGALLDTGARYRRLCCCFLSGVDAGESIRGLQGCSVKGIIAFGYGGFYIPVLLRESALGLEETFGKARF